MRLSTEQLLERVRAAENLVRPGTRWRHRRDGFVVRVEKIRLREETAEPSVDYDHDGIGWNRTVVEFARAFERVVEPPKTEPKGCNRHVDCEKAGAAWREKHGVEMPLNQCCSDPDCEDCFGC